MLTINIPILCSAIWVFRAHISRVCRPGWTCFIPEERAGSGPVLSTFIFSQSYHAFLSFCSKCPVHQSCSSTAPVVSNFTERSQTEAQSPACQASGAMSIPGLVNLRLLHTPQSPHTAAPGISTHFCPPLSPVPT